MADLMKQAKDQPDSAAAESAGATQLDRTFERMFDFWPGWRAMRFPMTAARHWMEDGFIKVDEFREGDRMVVRAELPGVDPEKDVEVTVSDGVLHIKAERREEQHSEGKGYVRQELRYGSFVRDLPLPAGVGEADITAGYKDGILEIKVPAPEVGAATKIPVTKN